MSLHWRTNKKTHAKKEDTCLKLMRCTKNDKTWCLIPVENDWKPLNDDSIKIIKVVFFCVFVTLVDNLSNSKQLFTHRNSNNIITIGNYCFIDDNLSKLEWNSKQIANFLCLKPGTQSSSRQINWFSPIRLCVCVCVNNQWWTEMQSFEHRFQYKHSLIQNCIKLSGWWLDEDSQKWTWT